MMCCLCVGPHRQHFLCKFRSTPAAVEGFPGVSESVRPFVLSLPQLIDESSCTIYILRSIPFAGKKVTPNYYCCRAPADACGPNSMDLSRFGARVCACRPSWLPRFFSWFVFCLFTPTSHLLPLLCAFLVPRQLCFLGHIACCCRDAPPFLSRLDELLFS